MKAYIRGAACISPQQTFSKKFMGGEIVIYENNRLTCIEPSYSQYLNPVMARRMGRIIKIGIASAMECLTDAAIKVPDAIITGTALGCLGETEKFLKAIIADDEQYLTPTSFIQSLQNSVSAQIALQIGCTGHNFTFTHKGFSFESALLDALMLIDDEQAKYVLTGGLDEMTDHNFLFYDKLGKWKQVPVRSENLFGDPSNGTIGGEGSSFFMLSAKKSDNDYACLEGVKIIYSPNSPGEVWEQAIDFLLENKTGPDDIDAVITGANGDQASGSWYDEFSGNLPGAAIIKFKHLCGEYQTASAFAMWIAVTSLKKRYLPEHLKIDKTPSRLGKILIYNRYENNHSLILVSKK